MENQQNLANQIQGTVPDERNYARDVQDEFTEANRDINQGQAPQNVPEAKESVVRDQGNAQREQEAAQNDTRTQPNDFRNAAQNSFTSGQPMPYQGNSH